MSSLDLNQLSDTQLRDMAAQLLNQLDERDTRLAEKDARLAPKREQVRAKRQAEVKRLEQEHAHRIRETGSVPPAK